MSDLGLATVEAHAFLRVPAAVLAERLARPSAIARWAPRLRVEAFDDRGPDGLRAVVSGELVGHLEWWLESHRHPPGTYVHFWLHGTATAGGPRRPAGRRWWRRRRERLLLEATLRRWRAALRDLGDELADRGAAPQ
ncbi:hypothetical protein DT076_14895 [Desertihabitans brevis]|uniref:Polyketide cyclase / dehydrase and lipid transport n=1 Tax=Desertihabitans brevis TaxID=2268447 RepID=A0A367YU77_9ACTN|nr:hypothetical protein [Desertihabitans brevis]RCK68531.1 hypothetical protein DT076_14895 [Desertihabitans brevis]